jgi:leucyl aminopeptidase (aminopeptidase T)
MSLEKGAKTIVNQCLEISADEHVLVLNDGNDRALLTALIDAVDDAAGSSEFLTYEEPSSHGDEPPTEVAAAMEQCDVFIAPTNKSLSHTQARRDACAAGSRGATLPGITREIWNTSLQADYTEVRRISERVFDLLSSAERIQITTPSGTDLTLEYDIEHFHKDIGYIRHAGDFGNLPAGEVDGGVIGAEGVFVVDHFPFAPSGTVIEIEDCQITSIRHPGEQSSKLAEAIENSDCVRQVAEFGFGTNPAATLIGNILQDEKVFGTVHVAFGDNSSYISPDVPQHTDCHIHWDSVCESPTVHFGDTLILDEGTPTL